VQHGGRAVYDLPGYAVALGVAAAVVSVLAWVVVALRGGWVGVVTAVVGALVVASAVTIPVLAVLLLVGGVVAMASRQQRSTDKPAVAAGLVLAMAVPAAALVASDGPVVVCHDDRGVSTSSSIFRSSSSSSGSGSGSGTAVGSGFAPAPGTSFEGTFRDGDRTYTYRCTDGRLTAFTAR
jgi:uncharacterized membrane protein YgcG